MADLRKCPFCGGKAEVVKAHSNTTEYPYVVVCKNDLCNASVGRFSTSREKAIEAWNTRNPMEAVVAELEKESNRWLESGREYKDKEEIGVSKGLRLAIEEIARNDKKE